MLGEQIGMDKGKVTARRVILNAAGNTVVETNFEGMGKLLGLDANGIGTYQAESRVDGTLFGHGNGVIMGKNGERAMWRADGVGILANDGAIKFRGAIYYTSMSDGWKKLNTLAGVYEHNVGVDGVTETKVWEWR